MGKFRTHTRDIAPEPSVKPKAKPGELPPNRIPVLDHKGRRRGHVGYLASESTVRRFGIDAKLGTKDGRPAWIGSTPEGSARTVRRDGKHDAQVKQAQGSVSKNPSPPVTSARPKRG